MSEPDGRARAVDAARGLTSALKDVWAELRTLNKYTHRTRHIVWGIILSLAIDAALTGWVYHVARQSGQADTRSVAAQAYSRGVHESTIVACQMGNARLARQRQALDTILTIGSVPPHASAARRRAVEEFRHEALAQVARGWAPRDCSKVYRVGSGPAPSPSALPRGRIR